VRVTGVKGEPPTDSAKVCMNNLFGYRNSMTVVLTGLDIEKKAKIVEETLFHNLGGKEQYAHADVQLIRIDKDDPVHNDQASAHLKISLMDPDQKKVGKKFTAKVIDMALSSIPGFTLTSPPANATPALQHWPTLVSNQFLEQKIFVNGQAFSVTPVGSYPAVQGIESPAAPNGDLPAGDEHETYFGELFATRSGDKGGNANLGVWAQTAEGYLFLKQFLTQSKLKELLPDMTAFEIDTYDFPNLLGLNFYIKGVLGEGVAASFRNDPQAKTLGEYLRAKKIRVPKGLMP